jgi:ribonuclease BN (tRNA processing enzyme)
LAALKHSTDPVSEGGDLNFQTWVEGEPVQVGPMAITPYRVRHPAETWGFRVDGPSDLFPGQPRVLSYSGDTDTCPGLEKIAAGADLLLIEAAFEEGRDAVTGVHLTGKRAGEAATAGQAKRVVVTHLPPWNDPAITLGDLRAAYSGPVYLARSRASYVI